MMESGEWQRGKTGGKLAKQWRLNPGTLEHDAAEASRRIRAAISDDEVREWADSWLERLCEEARDTGDYRACVAAIKARVDIRGILVQRHEVTHREQQMTDEELIAEAMELLQEKAGSAGREAS